jgi:hypothetical protein
MIESAGKISYGVLSYGGFLGMDDRLFAVPWAALKLSTANNYAKSQENEMIRRALLLLAIAGIYVAIKRSIEKSPQPAADRAADARWANEGGAHAPASY